MSLLIPRIFHRFWAGPEMPAQHREWIAECQRLHPAWIDFVWDEVLLPSRLQHVWSRANVVQRSDIAGYWLVYRNGGVYCDTDYQWYQSIEPWLVGCEAFFAFANHRGDVTASIFGGVAGHPAFKAILDALPGRFRPDEQLSTSSRLLAPIVKSRGDVRIYEHKTFLPLTYQQHKRGQQLTFDDIRHSVARHRFAGSWLKSGEG